MSKLLQELVPGEIKEEEVGVECEIIAKEKRKVVGENVKNGLNVAKILKTEIKSDNKNCPSVVNI